MNCIQRAYSIRYIFIYIYIILSSKKLYGIGDLSPIHVLNLRTLSAINLRVMEYLYKRCSSVRQNSF
jgi:hypothetical protein